MGSTKTKNDLDFKALFEAAPGLFLVLDPNPHQFTILGVSDAYLRETMTKREEFVGRGLFEVFPENPDDSSASGKNNLRKSLEHVIQKKTSDTMAIQKYDIQRSRNEGVNVEEKYWSALNTPVFNNKKEIEYIIHLIEDVTQLKDSEDKLKAINKELEAFSYSVSHDLRAPLRAITGYTQMLQEDYGTKLGSEGNRLIQTIQYNGQKMGKLIDDLLTFSRLGAKEMQETEINMNDLMEGLLIELNKTINYKAKIKVDTLHTANGDYGLLYQVVYNLVSNAIKYSSKNEDALVEISSKQKNGETIFLIKDNGVGFDMRYANKLFGVFQRLHSNEEFEGTGVGLAIVQRIIAKHGGKVWAEAEVNKGATFYFSVP